MCVQCLPESLVFVVACAKCRDYRHLYSTGSKSFYYRLIDLSSDWYDLGAACVWGIVESVILWSEMTVSTIIDVTRMLRIVKHAVYMSISSWYDVV